MPVGFKIKKLREEMNLSQSKLADYLEITQSELSKIENGIAKKIDIIFIAKLCDFFNKDCTYFTNRKSTSNEETGNDIKKSVDVIMDELKKLKENLKK